MIPTHGLKSTLNGMVQMKTHEYHEDNVKPRVKRIFEQINDHVVKIVTMRCSFGYRYPSKLYKIKVHKMYDQENKNYQSGMNHVF